MKNPDCPIPQIKPSNKYNGISSVANKELFWRRRFSKLYWKQTAIAAQMWARKLWKCEMWNVKNVKNVKLFYWRGAAVPMLVLPQMIFRQDSFCIFILWYIRFTVLKTVWIRKVTRTIQLVDVAAPMATPKAHKQSASNAGQSTVHIFCVHICRADYRCEYSFVFTCCWNKRGLRLQLMVCMDIPVMIELSTYCNCS